MEVIVIAIGVTTLIYVLVMAGLAYELKRAPRPYPEHWRNRYMHAVQRLRSSLWVVFTLLGINAVLFFFPATVEGPAQRAAVIFGGLDLICALVLYGVWRWAGWLQKKVATK